MLPMTGRFMHLPQAWPPRGRTLGVGLASIPARSARLPTNPILRMRRIEAVDGRDMRAVRPGPGLEEGRDQGLDVLLGMVARGDQDAFEAVYDRLAGPVYGLIRRVVRDPAQSEEVAQEVLLEAWRCASRFDPARGSAATWVMTIAHRRAVDRVRSAAASAQREQRTAQPLVADDEVAETAAVNLDAERVRRCLDGLTELQRESITLAYYGGYTYPEVAGLLHTALGTVKTRIRDGLIRLRDCMGVS
jgi:RNA polymerase sigma-70 factor (ECF subfamily)